MKSFKELMNIDQMALDQEWLHQPGLFMRYASELSEASRDCDKQKEKLETVKSELMLDISKDPEKYGLQKTTQALMDATLQTMEDYQKEVQEYIDKKYEKDMLLNAVRALEQRKSALENLVKLHGQNYFSSPVSSEEHREKIQELKKNFTSDIIKERRRRRSED